MKRRYSNQTLFAALAGFVLLSLTSGTSHSQQTNDQQPSNFVMSDGMLRIQASLPDQVRMGEQFMYRVVVTNQSDAITIHDVKLKQSKAEGFSIESTSMEGKQQQGKQQQGQQQQQKAFNEDDGSITIGTLQPGETQTLVINAAADKEGELRSCLELDSYRPSVCLTTQVVKPEIEIVKSAPAKAGLCELIVNKYTVTNSGSGNIERFSVIDDLPEGLITIDGEDSLNFSVDGLKAGETRAFEARLLAKRAGDYRSRAVAKADKGDLTARSANTTTQVLAAELNTNIEGPSTIYSNQPATYIAKVTNTGNQTAEDVRVRVRWPAQTQLARLDDPQMRSDDRSAWNNESQQRLSQNQIPVVADQTDEAQSDKFRIEGNQNQSKQDDRERTASMDMDEDTFTIASLEPNQTASFRFVIQPSEVDKVQTEVIAETICELDGDIAIDEAQSTTTSRSLASTDVIRLAALRILAVDNTDPVSRDQEVTYTVVVTNQGDAPDSNVKVEAELPEGLEFVNAEGPVDFNQDGSTVSFEPVETLEAGADARYTITAKAQGDGDVIFKATLNSDSLRSETTSEEPTRLFSGQAAN